MQNLPDENSKRFVAVLNKKYEVGRLMNALGHMSIGLAGGIEDKNSLCLLGYKDKEDGVHPNISHFPVIVLKAKNSNKIRKVRDEAMSRGIPFTDFADTMTIGTSEEQLNATAEKSEEELDYIGIMMFGETEELREFTKNFSLFD